MEEWINFLQNLSSINSSSFEKDNVNKKLLINGCHSWYVCSHARPTYCNVCREALSGVTSHGLSCEICKYKTHKRCASKAQNNCKWTTLASIGKNNIIEDENEDDHNVSLNMQHQWLEGNLPVNAKCSYCDKPCGSVLRIQDLRCLWCRSYIHLHCKDMFKNKCDLGICKVSILPPTHVNRVSSDGYLCASKAPNTSPLVVFVNSKSGDNQGIKFLRKFKQLLNPAQVFDLTDGGPSSGLRLFQKFDCFRVLVCGGDGSVGWVLREIDKLNLHKQCQIGVLPLGTGNDLARVLGWGAVLDDDNQVPKLLESFERATTKMLDRWSILTYNNDQEQQQQKHASTLSLVTTNENTLNSELKKYENIIYYQIDNLISNNNTDDLLESTYLLNDKINEFIYLIQQIINNNSIIDKKIELLRLKLDKFFGILKFKLILHTSLKQPEQATTSSSVILNESLTSKRIEKRAESLRNSIKQFIKITQNLNESNNEFNFLNIDDDDVDDTDDDVIKLNTENSILLCSPGTSTQTANRPKTLFKLNNRRKKFYNFHKTNENSIIIADDEDDDDDDVFNHDLDDCEGDIDDALILCSSISSNESAFRSSSNAVKIINKSSTNTSLSATIIVATSSAIASTSVSSSSTSTSAITTAPTVINNSINNNAPLALEEQSRISTPNSQFDNNSKPVTTTTTTTDIFKYTFNDKPQIQITNYGNKSASVLTVPKTTEQSSLIAYSKPESTDKQQNKSSFLSIPFINKASSNIQLSSSAGSNNNLSMRHDSNYLGLPPSPSAYSSSGSCFSKTPLPSPRISKKYSKVDIKNSSYYLQLSRNQTHRGISAFSTFRRHRSNSKSSDRSSSPTTPSSPKYSSCYLSSPLGFVGQALLFNTDALCAPVTPPVILHEPMIELYKEKAVMNNYFGIGLDAKVCLEFHYKRTGSRIRNHMLYGLLGSKELVQPTYKNLEQKVLLECDGTRIPLRNVQGIVVLNIPSYTGGVNFWGQHSKDDDIFTVPSFDDKILEVVAVSGCFQMALSRVVNIKSNRIAQCRSVKIQIIGNEGVPVQVDGEAWMQPPGFIYLMHKNRAQMLTRNKVFEQTLKTWSEKQKNEPMISSLSKEEFTVLQAIIDSSATLIKRIKTISLKNASCEQELYGYANQASSNLDEISHSGKLSEKCLRQNVTDFLNSIKTLQIETSLFLKEKAVKNNIDMDTVDKIQNAINELKVDLKKLNECNGTFQFPIEDFQEQAEVKHHKSRFSIVQRYKKSKTKHKDDKELLKTLHGIPIEEWGPEEVSLWLETLHLTEYKAAFLRHDIRGTEIRNLERRDLRELGIVKVGHIKRILNASRDIPKHLNREKQSV